MLPIVVAEIKYDIFILLKPDTMLIRFVGRNGKIRPDRTSLNIIPFDSLNVFYENCY